MKKFISIALGLLIILVGVPTIVRATPPPEKLIFVTLEEFRQAIDRIDGILASLDARIKTLEAGGGGGGGEDFDIPQSWQGRIQDDNIYLYSSGCFWRGTRIKRDNVHARAVAKLTAEKEILGTGTCEGIYFGQFVPEAFPTIQQVDIWFYWMGKEKYDQKLGIEVTPDNCLDKCDPDEEDETKWVCAYSGYTCQEVEGVYRCVNEYYCPAPTPTPSP